MSQLREPITAASLPDYDDWGWDSYWSANDWMEFHKALVQAFGKTEGNKQFLEHWLAGPTFLVKRANYLSFNDEFIEYFEAKGLLDKMNSGFGELVSDGTRVAYKGGKTVLNAGGDVIDGGKNILDGAVNTAKILKWLIPVVALALIAFALWQIHQKADLLNMIKFKKK